VEKKGSREQRKKKERKSGRGPAKLEIIIMTRGPSRQGRGKESKKKREKQKTVGFTGVG